jgi:hypothetical protein
MRTPIGFGPLRAHSPHLSPWFINAKDLHHVSLIGNGMAWYGLIIYCSDTRCYNPHGIEVHAAGRLVPQHKFRAASVHNINSRGTCFRGLCGKSTHTDMSSHDDPFRIGRWRTTHLAHVA